MIAAAHSLQVVSPDEVVRIWRNRIIPVVFCCAAPPEIRVKLPYSGDNRKWIQPPYTHVRWDKNRKCWIVANSRFSALVRGCLQRYGRVYVIQHCKELEKCAPACWNAIGIDCECSCRDFFQVARRLAGTVLDAIPILHAQPQRITVWGPGKMLALVAEPALRL